MCVWFSTFGQIINLSTLTSNFIEAEEYEDDSSTNLIF